MSFTTGSPSIFSLWSLFPNASTNLHFQCIRAFLDVFRVHCCSLCFHCILPFSERLCICFHRDWIFKDFYYFRLLDRYPRHLVRFLAFYIPLMRSERLNWYHRAWCLQIGPNYSNGTFIVVWRHRRCLGDTLRDLLRVVNHLTCGKEQA